MKKIRFVSLCAALMICSFLTGFLINFNYNNIDVKRNLIFEQHQLLDLTRVRTEKLQKQLLSDQEKNLLIHQIRGNIEALNYIAIGFQYFADRSRFKLHLLNLLKESDYDQLNITLTEAVNILEKGINVSPSRREVSRTVQSWNEFLNSF